METYSRNDDDDDGCPQLLDLISKESREWVVKREDETRSSHGGNNQDEKKLELSLGPPGGGGDWTAFNNNYSSDLFSFGYFQSTTSNHHHHKFSSSPFPWPSTHQQQPSKAPSYLQLQSTSPTQSLHATRPRESSSSLRCCGKVIDLKQSAENKPFSPPAVATAVVPNSAQKRTAPAPVVGWPPIRSFRKNLANSSSSSLKSAPETPNLVPNKVGTSKEPIESTQQKSLFVKINMDCIPIGRKVDLNAYDSYEKLSSAVDELFRGLLAAQSDSSAGGTHRKDGDKAITGLLDGNREYTLVYEDNEGDMMLVGDVPWHMFVSTVKRLRVLKSSDLPMLTRENKHGKLSLNC